jgi:hypothetical protein
MLGRPSEYQTEYFLAGATLGKKKKKKKKEGLKKKPKP